MALRPLIAYSIALGDNDPKYDAYTDAYGLEMSFDDEWAIDAVICAPPKYVPVIASDTDVTSSGVSIGTNARPKSPDWAANATWIIVDADADEGFDATTTRLNSIVHASSDSSIVDYLERFEINPSKLAAVALHLTDSVSVTTRVKQMRSALDSRGLAGARILAFVASSELDLSAIIAHDDLDGFYHPSSSYDELLEHMESLANR